MAILVVVAFGLITVFSCGLGAVYYLGSGSKDGGCTAKPGARLAVPAVGSAGPPAISVQVPTGFRVHTGDGSTRSVLPDETFAVETRLGLYHCQGSSDEIIVETRRAPEVSAANPGVLTATYLQDLYRQKQLRIDGPQPVTYSGLPGYRSRLRGAAREYGIATILIADGRLIDIYCRWKDRRAALQTGCDALVASIVRL